jgi:hypothetical protein
MPGVGRVFIGLFLDSRRQRDRRCRGKARQAIPQGGSSEPRSSHPTTNPEPRCLAGHRTLQWRSHEGKRLSIGNAFESPCRSESTNLWPASKVYIRKVDFPFDRRPTSCSYAASKKLNGYTRLVLFGPWNRTGLASRRVGFARIGRHVDPLSRFLIFRTIGLGLEHPQNKTPGSIGDFS